MNTKEDNCSEDKTVCSLLLPAHQQLEYCCESACDKQPIIDYVHALEERIEYLETLLQEKKNNE